jgi:hypothetical protein
MTTYNAVVVERADIATVTIVCQNDKCNSEVSILAETAVSPIACPSCGHEYGKSVAEALAAFSRFHKFAHGAEDYSAKPIFRFTIKQSDVCRVASDQLKQ